MTSFFFYGDKITQVNRLGLNHCVRGCSISCISQVWRHPNRLILAIHHPWKLHANTHTSHLIGRYISPIPFFPFGSELRRRDRALLYRDGSPFPPPSFCSRFLIVDCYGDCQELFFIHLLSLSHSLVKNYVLAWFSCQKRFYLLYFLLSDLTWWWLDLAIKEI